MKKIILIMATFSVALANAQVGINQETPKATLDISVKKDNIDNESQEGLLIPRVTKEKALKMANNTTAPEESVLIYVNDVAGFTSAPDEKVNDITEKGYYFWNGTKWVKSSGVNGELWAQRDKNGLTETYLKPVVQNDTISYLPNQGFLFNLELEASPNKYLSGVSNHIKMKEGVVFDKSFTGHSTRLSVADNVNFQGVAVAGDKTSVELGENLTMRDFARVYGKHTLVNVNSSIPKTDIWSSRNVVDLKDDVAVQDIWMNQSVLYTGNNNSARNVGAFYYWNFGGDKWSANKVYGVYLDRIVNGQVANYGLFIDNVGNTTSTDNYAIYTNKGNIRFGQLKGLGERLVIANNEGVLSTSTASVDDFVSLWANDDTAELVKLKATSNGAPRVSTSGADRNDVTIDNDGRITARGFVGYNGATIFPDYVFEKYYTGESAIKADYNFYNLASVESFIKTNGHLPGYTSAKKIAEKGLIDISATQLTNVEKIEELYLHTIEQEKAIKSQKEELKAKDSKIEKLEKELNEQKMRLERLEKLLTK